MDHLLIWKQLQLKLCFRERKASEDIPSESEIHDRLAKLKDMPKDVTAADEERGFLINKDKRSDVEKARDLMKQYRDEVEIDMKHPTPEDDIAMRLAKLKGQTYTPTNQNLPDPSKFAEGMGDDTCADAKKFDVLARDLNNVMGLLIINQFKSPIIFLPSSDCH